MEARERASSFQKIKLKSPGDLAELEEPSTPRMAGTWRSLGGLNCYHPHSFKMWNLQKQSHHEQGVLSAVPGC
jgi:hypothetical protein